MPGVKPGEGSAAISVVALCYAIDKSTVFHKRVVANIMTF